MVAGVGVKGRVFILTGEPPEKPGGLEHVVREIKLALENRGYIAEVLHRKNATPEWAAEPKGKWQGFLADVFLSWYLGNEVAKRMGDDVVAVLSNGPIGWYLPRLSQGVKKIHFYHGTYRGQAEAIKPFISRLGAWKLKWWDSMVLERWSGKSKIILCNSDQTRAEVSKFFGFACKTLVSPLDLQRFRPHDVDESRQSAGLANDKSIGIFVGSTEPTKGFPIVRRMMDELPEVQWIMALRGKIPEDLKTDSRVKLFENASTEILPTLYSAADFAICPSRYEAFGYVVAEALACGTPVVASPGGASRFLLSDSPLRGCLISHCDAANDFLAAIRSILKDPGHYRELVKSAIRPAIEETMAPEQWVGRFFEATGL